MRLRDLAVGGLVLLGGCPDKSTPAGTPNAPATRPTPPARTPVGAPKTPQAQAEVEFSGFVDPSVKAARYVVFFSREPCDSKAARIAPLGKANVMGTGPYNFFDEIIVDQGTMASICGVALDEKGMVVGFGAYDLNPVTLRGQGEVEVHVPKLKLTALPPQKAPEGL
jgi:hypothetical protein